MNCKFHGFLNKSLQIVYLIGFIFNRFIYTGSIDISLDIAQDLLRAADQYLLEGLKRLCEYTIAQVSFEGLSTCECDLLPNLK